MNMEMEMKQPARQRTFATKWSPALEAHGYTNLPNLLLSYRAQLGITPAELLTLVAILSFKWDDNEPWPSLQTIAARSCGNARTIRAHIASLEKKNILRRKKRNGRSNRYDLSPLIDRLDAIATTTLPRGRKEPPGRSETRQGARLEITAKEDAANEAQYQNPTIKREPLKKAEGAWEIAGKKFRRPP